MEKEPEPARSVNEAYLCALYQVTAGWYANDAQLIWNRLMVFIAVNSALVGAHFIASRLTGASASLVPFLLPMLGTLISILWLFILERMWKMQDFQAAVLREQEVAMGLSHLGAYSLAWKIRQKRVSIVIGDVVIKPDHLAKLVRNRSYTKLLVLATLGLHLALLLLAAIGLPLDK